MSIIIDIDSKSGFCPGVVTAIKKAEEELLHDELFSLGDIMHNKVEMSRLADLGLQTINHSQLKECSGKSVLIRAHGEPPCTYQEAAKLGVHIVDATCKVVAHLQKIVRDTFVEMEKVGGQVVLFGKKGHPEVVGLVGQIDNRAVIIEKKEDLDSLDFSKPITLISQTTKDLEEFENIADIVRCRAKSFSNENITIKDTICRQVSGRFPHLKKFATQYDLIIFVCGSESSNGKVLYQICKSANPNSYKVEDYSQVDPVWFDGVQKIGICGATSTPKWLMEQIKGDIEIELSGK